MEKRLELRVGENTAVCYYPGDVSDSVKSNYGIIEIYKGGFETRVLAMKITVMEPWGLTRYAQFVEDLLDKVVI